MSDATAMIGLFCIASGGVCPTIILLVVVGCMLYYLIGIVGMQQHMWIYTGLLSGLVLITLASVGLFVGHTEKGVPAHSTQPVWLKYAYIIAIVIATLAIYGYLGYMMYSYSAGKGAKEMAHRHPLLVHSVVSTYILMTSVFAVLWSISQSYESDKYSSIFASFDILVLGLWFVGTVAVVAMYEFEQDGGYIERHPWMLVWFDVGIVVVLNILRCLEFYNVHNPGVLATPPVPDFEQEIKQLTGFIRSSHKIIYANQDQSRDNSDLERIRAEIQLNQNSINMLFERWMTYLSEQPNNTQTQNEINKLKELLSNWVTYLATQPGKEEVITNLKEYHERFEQQTNQTARTVSTEALPQHTDYQSLPNGQQTDEIV